MSQPQRGQQVRILIIAKDVPKFQKAGQFLTRRGWPTYVVGGIKQAVEHVVKFRPTFVMVSFSIPNGNITKLPNLLSQTFNATSIAFGEGSDPKTSKRLNQCKLKHIFYGALSGPSIHMRIKKILMEMEKEKRQAAMKANQQQQGGQPMPPPPMPQAAPPPGQSADEQMAAQFQDQAPPADPSQYQQQGPPPEGFNPQQPPNPGPPPPQYQEEGGDGYWGKKKKFGQNAGVDDDLYGDGADGQTYDDSMMEPTDSGDYSADDGGYQAGGGYDPQVDPGAMGTGDYQPGMDGGAQQPGTYNPQDAGGGGQQPGSYNPQGSDYPAPDAMGGPAPMDDPGAMGTGDYQPGMEGGAQQPGAYNPQDAGGGQQPGSYNPQGSDYPAPDGMGGPGAMDPGAMGTGDYQPGMDGGNAQPGAYNPQDASGGQQPGSYNPQGSDYPAPDGMGGPAAMDPNAMGTGDYQPGMEGGGQQPGAYNPQDAGGGQQPGSYNPQGSDHPAPDGMGGPAAMDPNAMGAGDYQPPVEGDMGAGDYQAPMDGDMGAGDYQPPPMDGDGQPGSFNPQEGDYPPADAMGEPAAMDPNAMGAGDYQPPPMDDGMQPGGEAPQAEMPPQPEGYQPPAEDYPGHPDAQPQPENSDPAIAAAEAAMANPEEPAPAVKDPSAMPYEMEDSGYQRPEEKAAPVMESDPVPRKEKQPPSIESEANEAPKEIEGVEETPKYESAEPPGILGPGTKHVPNSDLRDMADMFDKGLVEVCKPKSDTAKSVDQVHALGVIPVRSSTARGYLLFGKPADEDLASEFFSLARKSIDESLKNDLQEFQLDEGFDVDVDIIDFKEWASRASDFMVVHQHEGYEVALAFFQDNTVPNLRKSEEAEDMSVVDLSSVRADVPAQFNGYINFKANSKMILYLKEGRTISAIQKQRLLEKNVNDFFIPTEDSDKFRNTMAQHSINQRIRHYLAWLHQVQASRKAG